MGLLDKFEKEYNDYIEEEFRKTLKTVKKVFKENGWVYPRDWKQIHEWHYLETKEKGDYECPNVKDNKIFLEWAESTQGYAKEFDEIDLTFDPISGGIPIEIKYIFRHEFYEGKLCNRFQKLSGANYSSFTPYGDYWAFTEEWKKNLVFGENGKPIEDIIPYYKAYSKGFMDGYFEFEKEIKDFSQIFFQNSIPIEKIFEEIKSSSMPFASRGYYYPNDDSKQKAIPVLSKLLLKKDGKKIGRNYKAWFYILKNPKPFIPLFRSFYFDSFKIYEEEHRKWNAKIEGYISPLRKVIDEIQANGQTEPNPIESKINPLKSIWLKSPKISFDEFLSKGYDLGLWDEDYNLIAKRGLIYGSGKSLLANIFISLKDKSINENIDHKEAGKLFCQFFKIEIDPNTENPYKKFQRGNEEQIKELRKVFK